MLIEPKLSTHVTSKVELKVETTYTECAQYHCKVGKLECHIHIKYFQFSLTVRWVGIFTKLCYFQAQLVNL